MATLRELMLNSIVTDAETYEENLEHSNMKAKYYSELQNLFISKKNNIVNHRELMSRQWVNMHIKRINTAKQLLLTDSNQEFHDSIKDTLRNYDVKSKRNGEYILLTRPSEVEGKVKQIVPMEETYEVVISAHLRTKHGNSADMRIWLEHRNYFVNKQCVDLLIKVCDVCIRKPVLKTPVVKPRQKNDSFTGAVEILNMSANPDDVFNYILIYEDTQTGFIQLRPLAQKSDEEISMELIKIFMDLGPPHFLETFDKKLFEMVMEKVNKLCNACEVIESLKKCKNGMSKKVKKLIFNWMKSSGSENWAIGCHMVQWNINNTEVKKSTPYRKVFGRDCVAVQPHNSDVETLHTEEDLGVDIKSENENLSDDENVDLTTLELNEVKEESINLEVLQATTSLETKHPYAQGSNQMCCECKSKIISYVYTCNRCKKSLHLYCGERRWGDRATTNLQMMCFSCKKVEEKLKELKKKAEEFQQKLGNKAFKI